MGKIGIRCPQCGQEMDLNKGGAFCDACQVKVWRRVAGRNLTDKELEELVTRGRLFVRGLRSRNGKKFSATLVLQQDGDVKFEFKRKRKEGGEEECSQSD